MRRALCRGIAGRAALLLLAAAAPQPIGSWLLTCPASGGCVLQHRQSIASQGNGRPGGALEVQRRGAWLVPVVTLQGLSTQMAVGGLLALQPRVALQFTPGPRADLACSLDGEAIVCAPEGEAVAATAAALPDATTVSVQVSLGLPGGVALPAQGRTLALSGTREALAELRTAGAAGESLPAVPGLDWIGFLDRVMRAAGFENGAAGLWPRLAGR